MGDEVGKPKGCCSKICGPITTEFRKEKRNLNHQPIDDFFKSQAQQWQTINRSCIWLLYRWALAIYFTGSVVLSLIILYADSIWFIYLTNWGFLMCMGVSIYSAVIVTIYHFKPNKFNDWTTLILTILTTSVYWTLLYIRDNTNILVPKTIDIMEIDNYSKHEINSLLMLIDQLLVAFPTRLIYVVYPICFALVYTLFTILVNE